VVQLLGVALAVVISEPPAPRQGWSRRERITSERAVLIYDPAELHEDQAQSFARLLDRGVKDVRSLVDPGLPPGVHHPDQVRFVVSDRVGISRTFRTTVLLPLDRVRNSSASYLHEIVHVLVPSQADCTWLSEGLASYLESRVAETMGGYDAHVFTRAGNGGIHAAARRILDEPAGRAVLSFVGGAGQPPGLDEDRRGVARPFYVLAQSFVRYLADHAGLDAVVGAAADADPPSAVARLTGRSTEAWKAAWLAAITARSSPAPESEGGAEPSSPARRRTRSG
jgi:hypothetical protein